MLADFINLDVEASTKKITAEYIWIGGSGMDLKSKARVMCDAYAFGKSGPTNRRAAYLILQHPEVRAEEPRFGIAQQYTLLQKDAAWPIGLPVGGHPSPQGLHHCGVAADKAFGREIAESHYKACLYAGIKISSFNGGPMPGQWEFQLEPTVGISAGDQSWVARYILEANWGETVREKAIKKLGLRHKEHIAAYGEGNVNRLTGRLEIANMDTFLGDPVNSRALIRVGRGGRFEDRRPASNMDPCVVTSMIAETTILWKP
ncbi:unnamed protein product [Dovyalis caffra]|uniref:glutamine synthetase n=1 Tax=Dovyalis caffra TaxID=77055 RepID=A0AAV1RQM9_9ROSI|nr:unnamed protein product [Dovyalis caffra]